MARSSSNSRHDRVSILNRHYQVKPHILYSTRGSKKPFSIRLDGIQCRQRLLRMRLPGGVFAREWLRAHCRRRVSFDLTLSSLLYRERFTYELEHICIKDVAFGTDCTWLAVGCSRSRRCHGVVNSQRSHGLLEPGSRRDIDATMVYMYALTRVITHGQCT